MRIFAGMRLQVEWEWEECVGVGVNRRSVMRHQWTQPAVSRAGTTTTMAMTACGRSSLITKSLTANKTLFVSVHDTALTRQTAGETEETEDTKQKRNETEDPDDNAMQPRQDPNTPPAVEPRRCHYRCCHAHPQRHGSQRPANRDPPRRMHPCCGGFPEFSPCTPRHSAPHRAIKTLSLHRHYTGRRGRKTHT